MRRPAIAIAAILVASGCLSGPVPRGGDGDGGPDGDAAVDEGMPFPGGHDVELRDVLALDVDGDGRDDLAVLNSSTEAADRGVYVLRGPQSDAGDLRYNQFANTLAIPYHAIFEDVVGDPELDLIILGLRDGSPNAVIEIYEQSSDGEFTRVVSRVVDGFTPTIDEPMTVAVAALTGSVLNDFVVTDLASMRAFLVDDGASDLGDGLAVTNPIELTRGGTGGGAPFEGINGVFARSLDGGPDDLLVIENFDVTWFENDPAGTLTPAPAANNSALFPIRTFAFVDLDDQIDGQEPLDIVGGGLFDFGAWFLDPSGSTVSLESVDWESPLIGELTDIAAGNLDSGNRPEVVLFIPNDSGPGGELLFYIDARRNVDAMSPLTPLTQPVTVRPDVGAMIDLDDNGTSEVWAFDAGSGEAVCVVFVNDAPTVCP